MKIMAEKVIAPAAPRYVWHVKPEVVRMLAVAAGGYFLTFAKDADFDHVADPWRFAFGFGLGLAQALVTAALAYAGPGFLQVGAGGPTVLGPPPADMPAPDTSPPAVTPPPTGDRPYDATRADHGTPLGDRLADGRERDARP